MPPRKPMGLGPAQPVYSSRTILWQYILQHVLDAHAARLTDIEKNLGLGYPFQIEQIRSDGTRTTFTCYKDKFHFSEHPLARATLYTEG